MVSMWTHKDSVPSLLSPQPLLFVRKEYLSFLKVYSKGAMRYQEKETLKVIKGVTAIIAIILISVKSRG